jgi:NADH-quinone oxidoreductase subunit N
VVALQSSGERDAERLEDYRGLAWRRPWLAGAFTAALLSLAGIPLTAGFLGKFYILAAGVGSALWLLALVLVGTSAVGLFYYLRVLLTLYQREPAEAGPAAGASRVDVIGSFTLAALSAVLVWLGVFPKPVIALIQTALGHWI